MIISHQIPLAESHWLNPHRSISVAYPEFLGVKSPWLVPTPRNAPWTFSSLHRRFGPPPRAAEESPPRRTAWRRQLAAAGHGAEPPGDLRCAAVVATQK